MRNDEPCEECDRDLDDCRCHDQPLYQTLPDPNLIALEIALGFQVSFASMTYEEIFGARPFQVRAQTK